MEGNILGLSGPASGVRIPESGCRIPDTGWKSPNRDLSDAPLLLAAGASFAQGTQWTGDYVPKSVEMMGTVSSTNTESTPVFFVYLNDVPYVSPCNNDKSKAWFESIKVAIQAGRPINILWDPNFSPTYRICHDYDYTGKCVGSKGVYAKKIVRISLK